MTDPAFVCPHCGAEYFLLDDATHCKDCGKRFFEFSDPCPEV